MFSILLHRFPLLFPFFCWSHLFGAIFCSQAHQERREIKDPRAAEDCQVKRASWANQDPVACRGTWGCLACREYRDQRWEIFISVLFCYNSLLNHGRLLNSMFAQVKYNACYFEFSINGLLEKGNMIHPVFIISIQLKNTCSVFLQNV